MLTTKRQLNDWLALIPASDAPIMLKVAGYDREQPLDVTEFNTRDGVLHLTIDLSRPSPLPSSDLRDSSGPLAEADEVTIPETDYGDTIPLKP